MKAWSGRAVQTAREIMARDLPAKCGKCGKPVTADQLWVIGHIKSRREYPELTWQRSNWQHEHRGCSNRSGQSVVIEAAEARGRKQAERAAKEKSKITSNLNKSDVQTSKSTSKSTPKSPVSPRAAAPRKTPPRPAHTHEDQPGPAGRLSWATFVLVAPEWLEDVLTLPDDAAPPLAATPVHEEAVGTYGPEACKWIESNLKERGRPVRLRWWQRYAIYRQLEHRADGSLCWKWVVESTPRRSGKSTRLRAVALWRLAQGERLFEPEQLVVHTGRDLAIVREVLRKAWPWAEARDGWATKRGMTEPEVSHGQCRWIARSKDSLTGYDACLALVDEAWDVKPSTIDDDLEPSMLERESPQLLLTSTAHRRATSLMRRRIGAALAEDDGETLLLLWGAPVDADISDPEVWRAASPYWSEDRRKMIAAKYEKAVAGEDDPEFDDPDPMIGFACQYLNQWRVNEPRIAGNAIVTQDDWNDLVAERPQTVPDSVAVESWVAEGVCVASAWKRPDGSVVVSVEDHPTLSAAVQSVAGKGLKKPVLVGASLAEDPIWLQNRLRATSQREATRTAVGGFIRTLAERAFFHDGSDVLTAQVIGLRISPGVDGPRIRSTGRADAIKAVGWCVQEAAKGSRMVLPSRFRSAS